MASNHSDRSAIGGAAITTNVTFPRCVAVVASADVTATVTFHDGTVVSSYPIQKGYNPIQATKIVFASGTLIALYN